MKSILKFSDGNSRTGIAASAILGLFLLIASGPSWAGCQVNIAPNPDDGSDIYDFGEVPVGGSSEITEIFVLTSCGMPPDQVALAGDNPEAFAVISGPGVPTRGIDYVYEVIFTPDVLGTQSAFLQIGITGGETDQVTLTGEGVAGAGECANATVTPTNHDFGDVAIGDSASVGITLDLGNTGNGRGKGEPQPCQLWNVSFDNCSLRGIPTQGTCEPFSYSASDFPTSWEATFEPTEAGPANDTLRFVLRSDSARGISGEFVELTVKLSGNGGDPDSDGDGVPDEDDNCPNDPNPGQEDGDMDGIGDACDPDNDNDGVNDVADLCPDTMIPEELVPTTGKLGRNRWVLQDDDTAFDTNAPQGGGPDRSFTIEQTGGCSCEQILDEFGVNPNSGQYKFGCSTSTMLGWISLVPTECVSSGEFCGGIAGIQCQEGLFCADDPNDDCPVPGGADCPGLCVYGTANECPTWTPLFD